MFDWSQNSDALRRLRRKDFALAFAIQLVLDETLCIRANGTIWKMRSNGKTCLPRSAENSGGKGYLRVTMQSPRGQVVTMAHKLVWAWFNGPNAKHQINHEDLVKSNNQPRNLTPATGAENIQHSYRNGRTRPWSKVRRATGYWRTGQRLVPLDVIRKIRARRASGALLKSISSEFGVSISHVYRLCQ